MTDVRKVLGLPPVDPDIEKRFGPPTYTEEQVKAYLAALSQPSQVGKAAAKRSSEKLNQYVSKAISDALSSPPAPSQRQVNLRNAYGLVTYLTEVAGASRSDLVVVKREAIRAVLRLAKDHPRYTKDKRTAKTLGDPPRSAQEGS